ncbi:MULTISPECIES: rhomboid family intramembrane serine protease [unclassified Geobacillus]|uniref:rhomboid family intramembrane serine protease n=1 Tax=unclassified Geobacillus TaxID=2642459 RepID=UPI000BE23E18|nr:MULTISPECIES: rhomboid family intramembrane serine protease [unclassified Geobacillus]PDM41336.1 rhomboid family intramembrane serine protease [Parageobacillus yumthangensis]PUF89805.1 rhomboid family intramembrane serine protease [Geobacillus sp. LYN3]RDV21825.1 rhomboid family intramembrane serine protease [Parageobacillus toebii]TXK89282.1 rhomboid family intramembrane serine protease [Geobacillus sp. AYS3]
MNGKMELLFWQLVYFFIKQRYRIIQMSNHSHEIWLESLENKHVPIVRVVRYDIDWSQWLKRDMEYAWRIAEQIQKRRIRRFREIVNIYVSTYPPVDDWEFLIEKPLPLSQKRNAVFRTFLIHSGNVNMSLQQLTEIVQTPIVLPTVVNDIDPFFEAERLKQDILREAREQHERERRLFEYGKPVFTYIFIALQVLVFLLMEWSGGSTNPAVLIQYGAKFNPLIQEGEWWRFFTPIFLHIGFLHLLMNTFALYYLGMTVERLYGSWRFFFIYLIAGFFGTLGSFLFTTSLSAGASGAIFGLFGALLYFGTVYRHLFFQTIGTNIIGLIIINLLFGIMVPGIDNAGHIGGLIGGFLASGIVHLPNHLDWKRQVRTLLVTVSAAALGLYIGF